MSSLFCRYDLRTTDAEAARTFYEKVAGVDCAPPTARRSP
jgi:predicted enzyme related to lactoylglutathione lyase